MKILKLFGIISLLLTTAAAQETFSDRSVRYDRWEDTFFPNLKGTFEKKVAEINDRESMGYTPKEGAMFADNLKKILSIFERCALLNPPRGLQVKAAALPSVTRAFAGKAPRLEALIEMYIFAAIADEKGRPGRLPETADYVSIHINNPRMLVGAPVLEDIYIRPARIADFFGHSVNETGRGQVTVLTGIKRPLYISVSREDFLRASIRYWQQKMEASASEGAKDGADRTALEEFERGRVQRQKDFQAAYAVLKKADPSAAEEFKKTFEQTEKELRQEMEGNKDYAVSKKDVLADADKVHAQKIRELRSELEALSAQEKREQAYYSSAQLEVTASGLVSPDHPGAEALIRINHELFNAARPQSDVQLIILDWHGFDPKTYAGGKEGFDLQAWLLAELYKREDVWNPILQILSD